MTQKRRASDLTMMVNMPLNPTWLMRLPAWQSSDPKVVRACLNMLLAAFHGFPCGTLSTKPETLATATGLSVEEVKTHMATLLSGWSLRKNKTQATFLPMEELANKLHENYGAALDRLQQSAIVAISAPDLFNSEMLLGQGDELLNQVGERTRDSAAKAMARGVVKKGLPQGAALTDALRDYLSDRGFNEHAHDAIWSDFNDYCYSFDMRAADWSSRFRLWVRNQIKSGKLTPDEATPGNAHLQVSDARQPVSFHARLKQRSRAARAAQESTEKINRVEQRLARVMAVRPAQSTGDLS